MQITVKRNYLRGCQTSVVTKLEDYALRRTSGIWRFIRAKWSYSLLLLLLHWQRIYPTLPFRSDVYMRECVCFEISWLKESWSRNRKGYGEKGLFRYAPATTHASNVNLTGVIAAPVLSHSDSSRPRWQSLYICVCVRAWHVYPVKERSWRTVYSVGSFSD